MNLSDTHCHLNFERFDGDRAAVLARAAEAGVTRILIPSIDLASSREVVTLAAGQPALYAAVGVHPTEARTWDEATLSALRELAAPRPLPSSNEREVKGEGKVVAIGEIGLDYYWNAAPHDLQQRALRAQLDLAAELELPVILHLREKGDAADGPCATDLLGILSEWVGRLRAEGNRLADRPGVLHSFSGSLESARRALDLGFYIGVTGPVTYRADRQELVRRLPPERLLTETDAPFLAPAPHRGRRNEPAHVRLVSDKIAALHAMPAGHAADLFSASAARLFRW